MHMEKLWMLSAESFSQRYTLWLDLDYTEILHFFIYFFLIPKIHLASKK